VSIAYKISEYNRKRKWQIFLQVIKPTAQMRVLDVGYSNQENSETDNFIEKHYPYPEMLTALGVESPVDFKRHYPAVKCVQYNGLRFPFADSSFDICWSNAVIEHVGKRNEQLLFLREINRVARRAFITTPNRYFPVEVHTRTPLLHFLPKHLFERYLRFVGKEWATGSYMNLLSLGEIRALLSEAGVNEYTVIKNRLLGFVLDFIVVLNLDD
jgi:SAM-dependent methyltransferase